MLKMMYINDVKHLCERDGVFYFVRRVPVDVLPYYSSNRISISLKTKSASAAVRASKSINQRLEDYWLGYSDEKSAVDGKKVYIGQSRG